MLFKMTRTNVNTKSRKQEVDTELPPLDIPDTGRTDTLLTKTTKDASRRTKTHFTDHVPPHAHHDRK
jgi:hypothetical protein